MPDRVYSFRDEVPAIDIDEPSLPQPWIHYLSNGEMHAFVSQAGGGFAWWQDAIARRLSRYRMHHLPTDRPGFYLYVAEEGQQAFCPTYQPTCVPLDTWRCSFLPGKAVFTCEKEGLALEQQLYITPDENLLVWDVTVANRTQRARTLDLTAYVELSQLDWLNEQLYGYYWRHMLKTWQTQEGLLYYLYQYRAADEYLPAPLVFFGATEKAHSFTTDRAAFMGAYRDESNPAAIEKHSCGNETMLSGEPCFAYQVRKTILGNGTLRLCWFLGVAKNGLTDFQQADQEAQRMAALARDAAWLDGQREKLSLNWQQYLGKGCCRLPDEQLQRMISVWGPVNCMTTARYSRAVNVEAPGIRGLGFRDTAQDMLPMCHRAPQMAKAMLKRLLSKQFPTGNAVHLIPLNPHELPDARTRCDSHLWLPILLYTYLAETGDFDVLTERVPCLSPENHLSECGVMSVWEHMMAAVRLTDSHLGAHGLPLTLKGDWNDIIGKFSEKGKGESVFAAMQYLVCLKLLKEIAAYRHLPEEEYLTQLEAKIKSNIEKNAYNGAWWYRCFDDEGNPIGGPDSTYGKLWLNPQSWAVISDVGTRQQQLSAMRHVDDQLKTRVGLRLISPGFATYPETNDPFTGYNPGNGENGAIFCHANAWAVIAQALLGDGDRAWEYYSLLAPQKALERVGLQVYKAEPYAWASNIVGPDNPKHGWANVTHITGTAAWMEMAAYHYLLGIRPKLNGLKISPVMPRPWRHMEVSYDYRGTMIHMYVENPDGVSGGVKRVMVDGAEAADGFVDWSTIQGKREVRIDVLLGDRNA